MLICCSSNTDYYYYYQCTRKIVVLLDMLVGAFIYLFQKYLKNRNFI